MFSLSRIQMDHFLRGFPTKILKAFLVHHPTKIQGPDFSKLKPICGHYNKRMIHYVMSTHFSPLKTIILKRSEVKWVTVKFLRTKVPCTLDWPYTEGTWLLWLFHLVCILYCGCFHLFCNVWVCICVGFVMCRCFGNMRTCIYCVLYGFVYVYLFLLVLSVLLVV